MRKATRKKQLCCILITLFALNVSTFSKEPKMVLISAKNFTFQMGSAHDQADEQPIHQVRFTHNFWMDITEVTQGRYRTLMSAAYSNYSEPLWGNPYGVGDNYPAYAVEWGDAALFCNARSKSEGLDTAYHYSSIAGHPGDGCILEGLSINYDVNGYRLPTEAEWEYACRSGASTDFFWGKDYDPYPATKADTTEIDSYAVWANNSSSLSSENADYGTHPVASTTCNPFGLYDMCGNVSEWVNDWHDDYSSEPQTDPIGSETETYHFVRGGNWGNWASYLRSSSRQFAGPDYYIYFCGFRTVLPIKDTSIGSNSETTGMASEFILEQNYPNPFNPLTTIQFHLPHRSSVTCAVYNTLGETVAILFNHQILDAGSHSIHFDATNLCAGTFLCHLKADHFSQIKKMILLK